MNNKKLAIVTIKEAAAEIYANQIKEFLGQDLSIKLYSFERNNVSNIEENIIIVSTFFNYNEVRNNSPEHAEIIIPRITVKKDSINTLMKIKSGTDAFLFNLSAEMAIDTISLLQRTGINQINFIPAYPGFEMQFDINLIITPGEAGLIKDSGKEIIDIGFRILDLSTILDVAARLGLSNKIHEPNIKKYFEYAVSKSAGLQKLLKDSSELESQFDILLNSIDDYVIVTNNKGFIYFHCNKLISLVGKNHKKLIGIHISDIIHDFDFNKAFNKKVDRKEYIINLNDIDIILEIRSLTINSVEYFIHKLRKFSSTENKQAKLRAKLYNKGHISKYSFDDIKGESDSIKETIHIAKRMANSFSSVLITGETGTGKELFAQAIHNISPRRDSTFVAVNCGLFHENLFESELFGYEEGSFTGAKKGGKHGLFEIAHKGTLFLDEIGEMNLSLQSKLLRVIQEKQIRRVGSERIIDIDVRIIAATNRDLMQLVKQGKFRKDLFYRLNVLPLSIKPLRDRKEDIMILFKEIQNELGSNYTITSEARSYLLKHNWEGNVRELRNVVEYLNNLNVQDIEPKHLPEYITSQNILESTFDSNTSNYTTKVKNIHILSNEDKIQLILKILYSAHIERKKIGRRKIIEKLSSIGVYITEQEVRLLLKSMNDIGLIISSKGRAGTQITQLGINKMK